MVATVSEIRGGAALLWEHRSDDSVVLEGGVNTGKCQPLDALVHTPSGPVEMGSLCVGQEVCTPSGRARIRAIYPQGVKPIYRVTFRPSGEVVECTGDHLWRVYNRWGRTPRTITLDELVEKWDQGEGWWVDEPTVVDYDARPVPMDPYTLGVLLGDGYLNRDLGAVFTSADPEVASIVAARLDGLHEVRMRDPGDRTPTYRIVADTRTVHRALDALGLWGTHANNKYIPDEYLWNSREVRLDVLRGLMDTDGTVDKQSGQPSFCSVSRRLAEGVQQLVQGLGGACSISEKETSGQIAYQCWLRVPDAREVFNLGRKRDVARKRKRTIRRSMASVEPVGEKPCQCIELDDEKRLYLTNGCIPTHNTHGWQHFALWFGEEYPGARVLILRKVRSDLIQSTLVKPWESTVIDGHLARGIIQVHGGEYRREYRHANGSVWVPGGLDKSSRHMGAQWDLIIFVEATECEQSDYEDLLTRTSRESGAAPYSFIILDTNPGNANHWINEKARAGHLKRLLSRHEDNPLLYSVVERDENGAGIRFRRTEQGEKFLGKLDTLPPGSRRDRLRDHKWATAEGLIWPEYGAQHYISRSGLDRIRFERIVAGFDWGHTEPAALEVFGIEAVTGVCYRVFECYRRERGLPWWSARFVDLYRICEKHFGRGVDELIYSHERREQVEMVNSLLVRSELPAFVRQYRHPSPQRRNEIVRWFWRPSAAPTVAAAPAHGGPMCYLVSGSQLWPAEDEDELGLAPDSWEKEIPGYTWKEKPKDKRGTEEVDPRCPNHACDAGGMALEACFEHVRDILEAQGMNLEPQEGTFEASFLEEARLLGLADPAERRRKRRQT